MHQVSCATLKFGDAIGRVNASASIRRHRAAFIGAPRKRVGTHSRRERRRNMNSWRMLDPSSGSAGGRRGKSCFSVSVWRSHFPFKLQFSEEPWKACLPTAIEVHRDLRAPFLLKALAAALFPFSSVQARIEWHYVADRRERKCLGLFKS